MAYAFRQYHNRAEAGQVLIDPLADYANQTESIVFGLARGGVPVAAAIARGLGLPLDVLLVRKLGVPGREELAFGAVAGGFRVLNERVVQTLGLSPEVIEATTARELAKLARREALYRGGKEPVSVTGRTVLLVDDGLATGASMRAAVIALRQSRPAKIVVAVPVAAESSIDSIRAVADKFVCPLIVPLRHGISAFYADFAQVSDEEVQAILAEQTG